MSRRTMIAMIAVLAGCATVQKAQQTGVASGQKSLEAAPGHAIAVGGDEAERAVSNQPAFTPSSEWAPPALP